MRQTKHGLTIVQIARLFLPLREAQALGQNQGQRINAVQLWTSGPSAFGESWCDDLCWLVLDLYYEMQCPFPRTASTDVTLAYARDNHLLVDTPEEGDLILSLNSPTDAHHIAIYTGGWAPQADGSYRMTTFAGNTSEDGLSSNGDRAAEHGVHFASRDKFAIVRVPK